MKNRHIRRLLKNGQKRIIRYSLMRSMQSREKIVWWHCKKCGNEWKSVINARIKGTVCPVCAEREVLAGYNDLATTDKKSTQ